MAWLFGIVTPAELAVLRNRGWVVRDRTKEVVKELRDIEDLVNDPSVQSSTPVAAVFVDSDLLQIMSGPDWEQ